MCPFNSRHVVPTHQLRSHLDVCEDRVSNFIFCLSVCLCLVPIIIHLFLFLFCFVIGWSGHCGERDATQETLVPSSSTLGCNTVILLEPEDNSQKGYTDLPPSTFVPPQATESWDDSSMC